MFTRKHSIFTLVLVCLFALSGSVKAQYDATLSVFDVGPSEQVRDTTVHSKSFGAKISHLFHNIKNLMWDVDSSYCEPRQYRGQIKLMDRIMYESLDMDADDGTGVAMHSHVANYVGPGVVFSPIGLSVKWDLSPHKYDDNGEDVDRQNMDLARSRRRMTRMGTDSPTMSNSATGRIARRFRSSPLLVLSICWIRHKIMMEMWFASPCRSG